MVLAKRPRGVSIVGGFQIGAAIIEVVSGGAVLCAFFAGAPIFHLTPTVETAGSAGLAALGVVGIFAGRGLLRGRAWAWYWCVISWLCAMSLIFSGLPWLMISAAVLGAIPIYLMLSQARNFFLLPVKVAAISLGIGVSGACFCVFVLNPWIKTRAREASVEASRIQQSPASAAMAPQKRVSFVHKNPTAPSVMKKPVLAHAPAKKIKPGMFRKNVETMRAACYSEIGVLCNKGNLNVAKTVRCLKKNEDSLAHTCLQSLKPWYPND